MRNVSITFFFFNKNQLIIKEKQLKNKIGNKLKNK